ncbi:hypothetical protein C0Q70_01967 [Pomacea canaliculata]|uniref:Endo-polygalacturonase n=1 Tax=Pomacea canaliculata TaxID=400727 RepID=A0A2T7Q117_POMCA|nr:hypothetical protein C0Q70_01967 [Pomacea canaliculata]
MAEVRIAVAYLLTVLPVVTCKLTIYPVADGAPTSDKFRIYLSQDGQQQQQSHVYITRSDHRYHEETKHVKRGRSMSWTSFAFTGGKVTVKVHAPKNFTNCIVRPTSYGYRCRRTGGEVAVFEVTENTKMMSVEFDYDDGSKIGGPDITDKLMVFADPPETSQPSKTDNSVIYYDAKVHDLSGQVKLNSNIREVYLAPGSFVKGAFKTMADHGVKIHGRGVLDSSDINRKECHMDSWAVIDINKGDNHIVEGITISDPCRFYMRALGTNNSINNIKMVGAWMYNNDGVVVGNNGTVADCFIHANDDAIKLRSDNTKITGCVIWQGQNGAVFQTGWVKRAVVHKVQISNIDIIHIDWCTFQPCNRLSENKAVFNHRQDKTKHFDISDVVMKDIRVEGTCPRVVYWKMDKGAQGRMRNIRFVNWSIQYQLRGKQFQNVIAGNENNGTVENVQFVNLRVDNRYEAAVKGENSECNTQSNRETKIKPSVRVLVYCVIRFKNK